MVCRMERFICEAYVYEYLKVSLKTIPSNCTEVLVTGFGHFKTQG